MKIVYDSLLGAGRRFAKKINKQAESIHDYNGDASDKLILLTRSEGYGLVPESTLDFMQDFGDRVVAVAVNGNQNWGKNFGAAGIKISEQYNIPLILIYEGTGLSEDVAKIKEFINSNNNY